MFVGTGIQIGSSAPVAAGPPSVTAYLSLSPQPYSDAAIGDGITVTGPLVSVFMYGPSTPEDGTVQAIGEESNNGIAWTYLFDDSGLFPSSLTEREATSTKTYNRVNVVFDESSFGFEAILSHTFLKGLPADYYGHIEYIIQPNLYADHFESGFGDLSEAVGYVFLFVSVGFLPVDTTVAIRIQTSNDGTTWSSVAYASLLRTTTGLETVVIPFLPNGSNYYRAELTSNVSAEFNAAAFSAKKVV